MPFQSKTLVHEQRQAAAQRATPGRTPIAPGLAHSSFVTAQRQRMSALFGPAAQTRDKDEVQRKADAPRLNQTGLPDNLKSGIESLSGISLAHVKVHYNSPQPAQLNALAYAQGSDIHVAPGEEKHLPHEAWHVVQQAQGRVRPTMQLKGGVPVNDDRGLEREADVMGAKALAGAASVGAATAQPSELAGAPVQRMEARLKRSLTDDEEATAEKQGTQNYESHSNHGRAEHGKRREVPDARKDRQASEARQEAIDKVVQLRSKPASAPPICL